MNYSLNSPNVENAVGAYTTAAARHYGVELNQIDQPSRYAVEETSNGVFRIADPKTPDGRDEKGRFAPPLATCAYGDGVWTVTLSVWTVTFSFGRVMLQVGADPVADE